MHLNLRFVELLTMCPVLSIRGQCLQVVGRWQVGHGFLRVGSVAGSLALINLFFRFCGCLFMKMICASTKGLLAELRPKMGHCFMIISLIGGLLGLYSVIQNSLLGF